MTGRKERMLMYEKWNEELKKYAKQTSEYAWDELEELITDDYEEEKLSDDEFDNLMRCLMEMDS